MLINCNLVFYNWVFYAFHILHVSILHLSNTLLHKYRVREGATIGKYADVSISAAHIANWPQKLICCGRECRERKKTEKSSSKCSLAVTTAHLKLVWFGGGQDQSPQMALNPPPERSRKCWPTNTREFACPATQTQSQSLLLTSQQRFLCAHVCVSVVLAWSVWDLAHFHVMWPHS